MEREDLSLKTKTIIINQSNHIYIIKVLKNERERANGDILYVLYKEELWGRVYVTWKNILADSRMRIRAFAGRGVQPGTTDLRVRPRVTFVIFICLRPPRDAPSEQLARGQLITIFSSARCLSRTLPADIRARWYRGSVDAAGKWAGSKLSLINYGRSGTDEWSC